jgi:hypothetical protein
MKHVVIWGEPQLVVHQTKSVIKVYVKLKTSKYPSKGGALGLEPLEAAGMLA